VVGGDRISTQVVAENDARADPEPGRHARATGSSVRRLARSGDAARRARVSP
jgi:hypothetical protein